MRACVVVLVLASIGFAAVPVAGLDSLSRAAIAAGLEAQGMREAELGFFKQWAVDSFFRLKIVDRMLDHPLEVVDTTESEARQVCAAESSPGALAFHEWRRTECGVSARDTIGLRREIRAALKPLEGTESLAAPVRSAIATVLAGYSVGKRYLDKAVAGLAPAELDRLLGEAPGFWKDEDDTTEKSFTGILHREFGRPYDTAQEVKGETILLYARKLDRRALAMSGLAAVMAADDARQMLARGPLAVVPSLSGETEVFSATTEWGAVVVGGVEDNTYLQDCCLIIDLGGEDRYFNRAGGAVGALSNPFSVVIDLEGDDVYESDRIFSQGAALFGTGVLIDCGGNDVYRSTHYAQGLGMFGTGVLWDRDGRDIYEAGFCAQGAGQYGVGFLCDESGNDTYRSFCYCQGFAGTWGYGLLSDLAGNDVYYAGGKYLHVPLLPHEYRSFAQGFAIGMRPDAGGGIAFLCDRDGNDFYDAEVFCQATSYWYSLGMLWDGAGCDNYSARQYSQGAGIHLSVGCLVDEAGKDAYYSRLGPSQGEGHDFSVGVLLDRKDDDMYYCSGGQGVGLTNSVGLFVDEDGNDAYTCVERNISHGAGSLARGFGGIGLFADLAGVDAYEQRNVAADSTSWTKSTYGSGTDLLRPATVEDFEPDVDTSSASLDSVITAPVETIFKTASMWRVGNAVKKVERARKELVKLGPPAIRYVFEKKADSKDGLESEAIELLLKAWPDSSKPYLYRALHDDRYLARQNAAYWLGKLGKDARDGVDSILAALKEKRVSPRRAVYALGDIGDSMVVSQILYLLKDMKFEPSRIVTAEACGKLKNPVAIPDLIATLNDPMFTVRSASEQALVALGRPSIEPLLAACSRLATPALGHALRALGVLAGSLDTLADPDLRERCGAAFLPFLGHKEPFVRVVAVEAAGRVGRTSKAELSAAEALETNPFVSSMYRQVLHPAGSR